MKKIQSFFATFEILSKISRIPWPHPPKAFHKTSRSPPFDNWYLWNSLTKLDDFIFTSTVSCVDYRNVTIIIIWPVSSAELNVKSDLIFSLYCNFPIFSDQYIHHLPGITHTVYVAGNCLVKFALITDSHLLDMGCQRSSDLHLKRGVKKEKYSQKAHAIKYYFLIAFSDKGHIIYQA